MIASINCSSERKAEKSFAPQVGVLAFALLAAVVAAAGCQQRDEVVVYVALDREFSEPILEEFTAQTGISTLPKYDIESTKTVGLTHAIISEANRPRCDVFWNNEILNTLRLEQRGLLDVYASPRDEHFPELFCDPNSRWHGFAARARVLLVNTELVAAADRPRSIFDMTAAKWKGRTGIAKPLFGTTATHAACLFALLGEGDARSFFHRLRHNQVQVLGGNKQVAEAVSSGVIAFGLTDTDDAMVEVAKGRPVVIVYPDREADQLGTLFIPNTIAVIRGGPNTAAARKLIDYALSREVETNLALGPSAQIPLADDVHVAAQVETPKTVKAMPIDFTAAAREWDAAAKYIEESFLAP